MDKRTEKLIKDFYRKEERRIEKNNKATKRNIRINKRGKQSISKGMA